MPVDTPPPGAAVGEMRGQSPLPATREALLEHRDAVNAPARQTGVAVEPGVKHDLYVNNGVSHFSAVPLSPAMVQGLQDAGIDVSNMKEGLLNMQTVKTDIRTQGNAVPSDGTFVFKKDGQLYLAVPTRLMGSTPAVDLQMNDGVLVVAAPGRLGEAAPAPARAQAPATQGAPGGTVLPGGIKAASIPGWNDPSPPGGTSRTGAPAALLPPVGGASPIMPIVVPVDPKNIPANTRDIKIPATVVFTDGSRQPVGEVRIISAGRVTFSPSDTAGRPPLMQVENPSSRERMFVIKLPASQAQQPVRGVEYMIGERRYLAPVQPQQPPATRR